MKKLRYSIIILCLLALCALALTSCGSRLDTPGNPTVEDDTQTLYWTPVKGATSYTVRFAEDMPEETVITNSISLEFLDPGKYTIQVKANGDEKNKKDSKWVSKDYERFSESGLRYQLINNGREYQLIDGGEATGDVVMESVYRNKPVTAIADNALYNNTSITSFTVSSSVKSIGKKAFSRCATLTSVTIPEGVTSIGDNAFHSSKVLVSVTLPNSITEIGSQVFGSCSALEEVTLGNSVVSIGNFAFSNCVSLKKIGYTGLTDSPYGITLPHSVKFIDQYAFTRCTAIESISFGSVAELGQGSFSDCTALNKISFGDSMKRIGTSAFEACTALQSITVPDTVEVIDNGAFYSCTALNEVKLGAGLREVGYSVFDNTPLLLNALINGKEMLVIDGWLIQVLDATKFTNGVLHAKNYDIYGIAGFAAADIAAIKQLRLEGVKYIGYAAFSCNDPAANPSKINTVIFDEALVSIGDAAFYACEGLLTADFANVNALETIGSYAFFGCKALDFSDTDLPSTVKSIGTRAFRNTKTYNTVSAKKSGGVVYVGNWAVDYVPDFTSVAPVAEIKDSTRGIANHAFLSSNLYMLNIADSVEIIGRGAFYSSSIAYAHLPSGLKQIGDYAFYNCYATSFSGDTFDLIIPNGTETIGRSAFYGCDSILSLTIPGSVKSIGEFAFFQCINIGATVTINLPTGEEDEDGAPITEPTELTGSITLSEGIESIGGRAFYGCEGIVDLVIPDSVKFIGAKAFRGCTALKNLTVGSGMTKIPEYTFFESAALESVVLRDGVKEIGDYAFLNCNALKNVNLGQVETIGRYSFYGCSALTGITLPSTLTNIKEYAFRGCSALKSVLIPASVETLGKHVFYGLHSTTIYAEASSAPEGWDELFNSSFRPVIWGCEIDADKGYIKSFTVGDDKISNSQSVGGITDPTCEGYVFSGWATEENSKDVAYTSSNVNEAEPGVKLYAVWARINDNNQTEG